MLQDDEYVVYSPDQVKLKYVVQFSVEGDKVTEFSPIIPTENAKLPSAMQGEPTKCLMTFQALPLFSQCFLWALKDRYVRYSHTILGNVSSCVPMLPQSIQ